VAAWLRCWEGADEHGLPIRLEDRLGERLAPTARAADGNADVLVDAMLAQGDVFGKLGANRIFRDDLITAVGQLQLRGARGAVAGLAEDSHG
jgi:mannitol-1-phosphate/altronate dehydrogenase